MKIFIILAIALNVLLITHSSGDHDIYVPSSEVSKIDFEPLYYLEKQDGVCEVQITDENECADAVAITNAQQGHRAGRKLQAGNWAWVPPSCSVQTGGDWAIHFNSRREPYDHNDSGVRPNFYTQVCKYKINWSKSFDVTKINKIDTICNTEPKVLSYSLQMFLEDGKKKMKEEKMEEEEELQMVIMLSNEEETNRLKAQELRKQDEDKKMKEQKIKEEKMEEEERLVQIAIKLSNEEETNRLKAQELRKQDHDFEQKFFLEEKQDKEKKMREKKMKTIAASTTVPFVEKIEEEERSDFFEGLLQTEIRLSNEEETNRLCKNFFRCPLPPAPKKKKNNTLNVVKIQKLRKQEEEQKMKEKKMQEEKMEFQEAQFQMAIKLSNEQETSRLEIQKLLEKNEILMEEKAEMTKKLLTEREHNLQENKKVLEHAECAMCLGTMVDPTQITCGHNFCAACLHTLCIAPPLVGKKPCPRCRVEFDTHTNYPVNVELRNLTENINNNILNQ